MPESVKPRRRYQSARRAAQAAQTRRDIVTAAGRLFRERGYGVPLAEIASEAGVVVETVYRIFGSKAALFRAAVEALLAGGAGRAEVPVGERPAIRAILDEPDPRKQVAVYAATQPGIHRRAGPLLRALRDARGSDPELGRLWDEMEVWRLDGQGRFVGCSPIAGPQARRHGRRRDRRDVDPVLARGLRPAGPREGLERRPLPGLADRHPCPGTAPRWRPSRLNRTAAHGVTPGERRPEAQIGSASLHKHRDRCECHPAEVGEHGYADRPADGNGG